MDEIQDQENQQPQEDLYIPRPGWQVWGARIGLVLFLLFVAYQIYSLAGGGL